LLSRAAQFLMIEPDVLPYRRQFLFISNDTLVIAALPDRRSGPAHQSVDCNGRCRLECTHNVIESSVIPIIIRPVWFDQLDYAVHMVVKNTELIKLAPGEPSLDGVPCFANAIAGGGQFN
jgi:hypothetical protein